MAYFYASERKKFEVEFEKFRAESEAAGMDEESIQEMYIFDKAQFNRDRAYITRRNALHESYGPNDDVVEEGRLYLARKFPNQLTSSIPDICEWGRHDWVEDLDSLELTRWAKSLSQSELEVVSYLVVDGMNKADVAREMNLSRAAITKKIARMKGSFSEG